MLYLAFSAFSSASRQSPFPVTMAWRQTYFLFQCVFSLHKHDQLRPESGESHWIPILPGFLKISICRKILVKFQNYISMNLWADGYDKVNGNIFLPWRLSEQKKNRFLRLSIVASRIRIKQRNWIKYFSHTNLCYFRTILPVHCESLQSLSTNKHTYYTKIYFTSSGCSIFRPIAFLGQLTNN